MMRNEPDDQWSCRLEALTSQEDMGLLAIKGERLPDNVGILLSGKTIHRPIVFTDVTFPACDGSASELLFFKTTFERGCWFQGCSFESRILRFYQCNFGDELRFADCTRLPHIVSLDSQRMRGNLTLRQCRFDFFGVYSGKSRPKAAFEKLIDIEGCAFNDFSMLDVECGGNCKVTSSSVNGSMAFMNCRLAGSLMLQETTFDPILQAGAASRRNSLEIGNCAIASSLSLERVTCNGGFALFNTTLDGSLSLADTALNGEVMLWGVANGPRTECDIGNVSARMAGALEPVYRYAKVAKASRGDLDGAGQCYYLERKARNAAARAQARWLAWPWTGKSRIWTWLQLFIGQGLLGFGERPLRPLAWGIATIILCAVLFWGCSGIGSQASSFWSCLYFSVVTFTTLGYGDLHPEPGLARAIAASEAILGMTLMSLFLVVLARRFMR